MPYTPNPLFVGRVGELRALAKSLTGGDTAAIGQAAAIAGPGGMGKTQLAVEFAHRYGRFFAGGVYWLSFADREGVPVEVVQCGLAGGLDLPPNYPDMDFESQVRSVLSAWTSAIPRLLVFDNCEEPELFDSWRPKSGGCRILLTTRAAKWDFSLGIRVHALEELPRPESAALLRKFRPDLSPNDPLGTCPWRCTWRGAISRRTSTRSHSGNTWTGCAPQACSSTRPCKATERGILRPGTNGMWRRPLP
jgi:hypothetical protein